jgi:hypothetical protein
MTVTIELDSQDEVRLTAAARLNGLDPTELLKKLVTDYLPRMSPARPDAENQALIDLLRSWRDEDATDDMQELERRDAETQEFLHNVAANRLTLRAPEL